MNIWAVVIYLLNTCCEKNPRAMADSSKLQDAQPPSSHNPEVLKPQMSNFGSPSACVYSCWPACYWHRGCRKACAGQEVSSYHMGRGQVVVSHQALTANSHPTAKALPRRKDGTLTSLNILLGSMSWTHALSDVDWGHLSQAYPGFHLASPLGCCMATWKTWIDLTGD